MSWFYRNLARPWLFAFESEEVHNRTLDALGWAARRRWALELFRAFYGADSLPVRLWGLDFPNPLGLAAGMDKQAAAVPIWEALGFGFVELGGVTWHPQPGNPAPRMFRIVEDRALINRMGFNNPGAERLAERLKSWRNSGLWPRHPVGINLGKSKITPLEASAGDYARSFRALWDYGDFFVVNVSSPNTPNLRQLQDKAALGEILNSIRAINAELGALKGAKPRPVLVKVAPDLSWEALDEVLEVLTATGCAGVVATNTTIKRPAAAPGRSRHLYAETGGLSGRPLATRSTEVIRHLSRQTNGRLPIIGVGGIFTARDAWEKLEAGAALLQVYTGLVYEGPAIAQAMVRGLRGLMDHSGIQRIEMMRRE